MKKSVSLFLSLLLVLSTGATAAATEVAPGPQVISCPEMEFSTLCDSAYKWNYSARDGITIYTGRPGSIPYVLVYRMEDWIVDIADYVREQYTPHMRKQYGADLVSAEEYDSYEIAGRQLAAGVYTYKLQGYLIDMIRAYEVRDRHTVVYTAKYIRDRGEATLAALEQAVAGYRPDPDYYDTVYLNPRWIHDVTNTPEGDILYSFTDISVTLPADWAGLYNTRITDKGISFYNSLSRSLWEEDGYTGGLLFTLAWSAKRDYDHLPSYDDIGKGVTGYYYLIYPTDVQAYNTSYAMEEYSGMYKNIGFIAENARITAGTGSPKG